MFDALTSIDCKVVSIMYYMCVQVSGEGKVNEEMVATVHFTNPFSFNLEGVYIRMEGPGIMQSRFKYYR